MANIRGSQKTPKSMKKLLAAMRKKKLASLKQYRHLVESPYVGGAFAAAVVPPIGSKLFNVSCSLQLCSIDGTALICVSRKSPHLLLNCDSLLLPSFCPLARASLQDQVSHGFKILRLALKAKLTVAVGAALVKDGLAVVPDVVPRYLLVLLDAATLQRPCDDTTASGRHRKDFVARYEIVRISLALFADILTCMSAPRQVIVDIREANTGSEFQAELLACVRKLEGFTESWQQALHYDLHREHVRTMALPGGVTTGAAVSVVIPCATAAAAQYVLGSHQYGLTGAAAHQPSPVPVQVRAGDLLISSPVMAHFGCAGSDLPHGLSHRAALFLCAHLAPTPKPEQVVTKRAHVGGEEQIIACFGAANYNNTEIGRGRAW